MPKQESESKQHKTAFFSRSDADAVDVDQRPKIKPEPHFVEVPKKNKNGSDEVFATDLHFYGAPVFLHDVSFISALLWPTTDAETERLQRQEFFSGHSQLLHKKTFVSHCGQKGWKLV